MACCYVCYQTPCCCYVDPCCDPCGGGGYPFGVGQCNTPQFGAPCFPPMQAPGCYPVYKEKIGLSTETVLYSPITTEAVTAGPGVSPSNQFVTIASSGINGDSTVLSITSTAATPAAPTAAITLITLMVNPCIVARSACKVEAVLVVETAATGEKTKYYKSAPTNLMNCATTASIIFTIAVGEIRTAAGDKWTFYLKYTTR